MFATASLSRVGVTAAELSGMISPLVLRVGEVVGRMGYMGVASLVFGLATSVVFGPATSVVLGGATSVVLGPATSAVPKPASSVFLGVQY